MEVGGRATQDAKTEEQLPRTTTKDDVHRCTSAPKGMDAERCGGSAKNAWSNFLPASAVKERMS